MFEGYNAYGGGFGHACAPVGHPCGYEQERESYGGSMFVLIVVLFILLIIVGRSFC